MILQRKHLHSLLANHRTWLRVSLPASFQNSASRGSWFVASSRELKRGEEGQGQTVASLLRALTGETLLKGQTQRDFGLAPPPGTLAIGLDRGVMKAVCL